MKFYLIKLIKPILIGLLLTIKITSTYAQIDTLHYLPPLYFSNTSDSHFEHLYLVLSTFESAPFTVTVKTRDNSYHRQVSISQSSPDTVYLGLRMAAPAMVGPSQRNTPLNGEGLIVSGAKPFFVNISERCHNHAEVITSKGTVGLGKDFYAGFLYSVYEKVNPDNNKLRSHFISFMAKENNTYVTISNPRYKFDNQALHSFTVVLQAGQSYTLTSDFQGAPYDDVTINHINGTHLTSNKPIAVTSGTWTGGADHGNARDVGIDQIVPTEIVGTEYALVRGFGNDHMEKVILIATENNTTIYINGSSTPNFTIANAGEYVVVPESHYTSNNNMYIRADKPVYAYQSLAGSTNNATPGMVFQPRLTCNASKRVQISYANVLKANPNLTLVTQAGSTVTINGFNISGAKSLAGNPNWVTYSISKSTLDTYNPGTTGDFDIESSGALNAALIVESNQIGGGGYYSGFGTVPEISYTPVVESNGICGSNVEFTASGYDDFTWYKDGEVIPGETGSTYVSDSPGRYKVVGITECAGQPSLTYPSNEIRILPCLSINPSSYSVIEGNTAEPNVTFTVELSHAWEEDDVTFTYSTTSGSASAGRDFSNISGSGTITRGNTSFTVSVPILNDLLAEDDETFTIHLNSSTNAVISNGTAQCTIKDDNDPKPAVSIPTVMILHEDTGSVQANIKLDRKSGQTISVDYAFVAGTAREGADYTVANYSGSLSFAPEDTATTLSFNITDDNINEPDGDETYQLIVSNLINVHAGDTVSEIQIIDNDPIPIITFNSSGSTEGNNILVDGNLSRPSSKDIFFDYSTQDDVAISPDDYSAATDTLTIPAGSTSFQISIPTVDDNIMEGTEQFILFMEKLEYARFTNGLDECTFTAKIIDNDGKPQISVNDASGEEGVDISFAVTLSHPASSEITFDYETADNTATTPADYTGISPTSFTLPANTLHDTIKIATVDNTNEEGNKSFNVALSNISSNAEFEDSVAIGTIIEDDDTPDARNDNFILSEDTEITNNVLTNDLGLGDPPISISSYTNPGFGSITMDTTTGVFTYQPNADYFGRDTIFYTIKDSDGDESGARVIFNISSVDDFPVANGETFNTPENTELTGQVLTNDNNLGDGATVNVISGASNGSLTLQTDGNFTYTPNNQFFGLDEFTYEITDGTGDKASAIVKINVAYSNDFIPIASNDTTSTQENVSVDIDVAANDSDQDGYTTLDKESVYVKSGPTGGVATPKGGGVITYTPNADFTGNDMFTYTIADDAGEESNEATVFVIVTLDNDNPVAQCFGNYDLYLDDNGLASLSVDSIDDGSYDPDGDDITRLLSQTAFGPEDMGIQEIILTIKDIHNASATCTVNVDVKDTISPALVTAPKDTIIYTPAGDCGVIVNYTLPVFKDNCDGESNGTLLSGANSGSVFTDTTSIVYEYIDNSGNGPVQARFDVIVLDTIAPVMQYSGLRSFIANSSNRFTIASNLLDVTVSDNCSPVTLSHNYNGGGNTLKNFSIPVGLHSITWTASDVSGNTGMYTYEIEVQSPISVTLNSLDPDSTVCQGEEIIFEATATGGSGNIVYDFQVDEVSVQSGANHSFTTTSLLDSQEVKVVVTDESLNNAESNIIPVTVVDMPDTDTIYRHPNK